MRSFVMTAVAALLLAGSMGAQMKVQPGPKPGTQPLQKQQQGVTVESFRRITIPEANKLVRAGKAVFVDVRSNDQFAFGHIKGAMSIPGSQLIARLREVPPGRMIIAYCACTAEQSSGRAVMELNARGVKNAAALTGGWSEWQRAMLPTAIGYK